MYGEVFNGFRYDTVIGIVRCHCRLQVWFKVFISHSPFLCSTLIDFTSEKSRQSCHAGLTNPLLASQKLRIPSWSSETLLRVEWTFGSLKRLRVLVTESGKGLALKKRRAKITSSWPFFPPLFLKALWGISWTSCRELRWNREVSYFRILTHVLSIFWSWFEIFTLAIMKTPNQTILGSIRENGGKGIGSCFSLGKAIQLFLPARSSKKSSRSL